MIKHQFKQIKTRFITREKPIIFFKSNRWWVWAGWNDSFTAAALEFVIGKNKALQKELDKQSKQVR